MHHIWRRDYLIAFFSASLKGISQVLLIDNAITGLIVLIAIMIVSIPLALIALASSIIGTWICLYSGANKVTVNEGIFGYNSVLTGLALSLYLSGQNRWLIAIVGAVVAALFTAALMNVLNRLKIPILTFPYILLTWLVMLASFGMSAIQLSADLVQQDVTPWRLHIGGEIEYNGVIYGISQIFFLKNVYSAVLILIGIFWAGWRLGVYAVVGIIISWLTAYGLGAEVTSLNMGMYGYNAVLAILAISVVYADRNGNSALTGIIAAIITVPITASINEWMHPYGLPALTMPFVLVTWLMISMRKGLPKL
ncbi:urea transporter [Paenibacillus endoradicis]|uniref:urea transporter n=1 Tax=Paenibacillus endoradicis TaxID=2972487 RepID=UPI0021592455|nr:urea transporter [Paenibacillus endoradicis]MCR8659792.1 urea transporter [Paenibacillus endoradicis]